MLLISPIKVFAADNDDIDLDFEIQGASPPSFTSWYDPTTLLDPYANALFYAVIYDLDNTSDEINVTLFYSLDGFGANNVSVEMNFADSPAENTYRYTYLMLGEPQGTYYQFYYQANDTTFIRKKPSEAGVYFDIQWDVEPVVVDGAGFWILPSLDQLITQENRWILWLLLLLTALTSFMVIKRNKNKRFY